MSQFQITIDTKRVCLLCLECTESDSKSDFTSFKLFLRYLKVDLGNLLQSFPSLIKAEKPEKNVGVILCNKCNFLMNDFLHWYENFEAARLCLDSCVQSMFSVLKKSEEFQENLESDKDDETNPHFQAADCLRKEALKKCFLRLKSYPEVELYNILNSHYKRLCGENVCGGYENCSRENPSQLVGEDNQITENIEATEEVRPEVCVDIVSKQSIVSSSQVTLSRTHEETNFPNVDLSSSYPLGLLSYYELQDEIFQTQLQKFPTGTTPEEVDDIIKVFLERNGKSPNDDPYRCTLPHEGGPDLSAPFPTRIDFRVHMLFCHFEDIETHLTNLNVTHTNPPFEGISPVVQDIPQISAAESNPPSSSYSTTNSVWLCNLCMSPQKFQSKLRSIVFKHIVLDHTFECLKEWLSPDVSELKIQDIIRKEVNKARRVRVDSIPKYQCPHCPAQFKHKCSIKYHMLRSHLEKMVTVTKNRSSRQRTKRPLLAQKNQCTFCPKTFPLLQNLRLHKELVHSFLHFKPRLPPHARSDEMILALAKILHEAPIFEEGLKFGCHQCRFRFLHKKSLKIHVLRKHLDLICWEIEKNRIYTFQNLETVNL